MSEKPSPEVFEARYSTPKLLLALGGALALVAASLFLLRAGSWIFIGAALPGIGFFGFAAAVIIRRLFDRRVQIRVDSRGVMVREWSEQMIGHRSIRRAGDKGSFVGLFLHKAGKYPTTNPMRRFLLRFGGDFQHSAGDIYIVKYQYDRSADALLEAMDRLRPRTAFEEQVDALVQVARASGGPE